jgi:hypothetical protein
VIQHYDHRGMRTVAAVFPLFRETFLYRDGEILGTDSESKELGTVRFTCSRWSLDEFIFMSCNLLGPMTKDYIDNYLFFLWSPIPVDRIGV